MGRIDVDAMLEEIDAALFREWMIYDSIRPFGEEGADLRAGIIASTMANLQSKKKFKPSDFMPCVKLTKTKSRRQTPDQMKAILGMAKTAAVERAKRGKITSDS